jgi:hypothetical protein
MRIRVITSAAVWLAAAPVFAQSADVTGPKTLTPAMVMCTDLPVTAKPVPRLVIKGPHTLDGRTSLAPDRLFIVNRTPDDGLAIGQRYVSQRLNGDPRRFPRPGEGYGDVRITGWLTITAIDEHNALLETNFTCDTIESGDLLEPYAEVALPGSATEPIKPDFSDRANFLFGVDGRVMFGDGDVASIDRGTLNGVVAGHRYAIYRDFHNGLPLVYVGEAVVMSAGDQTSKVVVTQVRDGVGPQDVAVPRRQPSQ